jgi:hypothetical protein
MQFEPNGAGGPVLASYVHAVPNCRRRSVSTDGVCARGGEAHPAAEEHEVKEAEDTVHELVPVPERGHAQHEDEPGGGDDNRDGEGGEADDERAVRGLEGRAEPERRQAREDARIAEDDVSAAG